MAAIESGDLDNDRFNSYLKLQRELKRLERQKSGKAAHLAKVEGKEFARRVAEAVKLKIRRR